MQLFVGKNHFLGSNSPKSIQIGKMDATAHDALMNVIFFFEIFVSRIWRLLNDNIFRIRRYLNLVFLDFLTSLSIWRIVINLWASHNTD